MAKILPASCTGKVVTSMGVPVNATILSEGVGSSTGSLLLEGSEATYIASNATDIKQTIEKLVEITTKISDTLTAINNALNGPSTAPSPAVPTAVAELNQMVAALNLLKGNLK